MRWCPASSTDDSCCASFEADALSCTSSSPMRWCPASSTDDSCCLRRTFLLGRASPFPDLLRPAAFTTKAATAPPHKGKPESTWGLRHALCCVSLSHCLLPEGNLS